jgi:hypothetical protein
VRAASRVLRKDAKAAGLYVEDPVVRPQQPPKRPANMPKRTNFGPHESIVARAGIGAIPEADTASTSVYMTGLPGDITNAKIGKGCVSWAWGD